MSAGFWWVNHSHSFREERDGSFLWFANQPQKSKARSESVKSIQRLLPGDVVYSFAEGAIGAVGVVLGSAREAVRPAQSGAGGAPPDGPSGSLIPVRFMPLTSPFRTSDHAAVLAPLLPRKHAPILSNGAVNQHVALAAVPSGLVAALSGLLHGEVERIVGTLTEEAGRGLAEDAAEAAIQLRADLSPAQKADLLKSRNGQGLFRRNLENHEHSCRVTRVLDRRHLWAVHIKPWSECTDAEKLDGCNGFLMAPHIAHLFERGYITFSDEGDLLVSQELNPVVLENWHIGLPMSLGEFRPEQCYYLDYHRREIFQQHGAGRRQKTPDNYDPIPVEPEAEPATVQPA